MSKWKTTDTENRQLAASFRYHFSFSHGTNAGETRATKTQQQNSKMLRQGPERGGRGLEPARPQNQKQIKGTENKWKKELWSQKQLHLDTGTKSFWDRSHKR